MTPAKETKQERRIKKEILIDASPQEVWNALTNPVELAKWFPLEAKITPGAGGKIFLSWGAGYEGEFEIAKWEPGKAFGWKDPGALVEWTLESRGGKTLVRLVQSAFAGGADWSDEFFDSTEYGWTFILLSLLVVLERHPKPARQVAWPRVKVNVSREEAYAKLVAPGGLFTTDAAELKPGEEYALRTTTGNAYTGRVEFVRTNRGLCVSMREMNDALLWLTIEGTPGEIEVQLWLSAFGLAQSEVDAFAERWQRRLQEMFAA